MAAPSPSARKGKPSHNTPIKKECRRRLIEHAVKHLTTERNTSVCVRREHVKEVWRQLEGAFPFSDEEYRQNMKDAISHWELFHDSKVQTKCPYELRVCYLAGEYPENDLEVLLGLGVLPQNVHAIEKDPHALQQATKSKFRNVRLIRGNILTFLKNHPEPFDIIYFDGCGALPSKQETLRFIGNVFLFNKLTSPGALITNFSFPPELHEDTQQQQAATATLPQNVTYPTSEKPVGGADLERDQLRELAIAYLKPRSVNTSGDTLPQACNAESVLAKRSDEENYGDYITFQVIDSAYLYIPVRRMFIVSPQRWDQIYENREDFITEVGKVLKALASECDCRPDEKLLETIKKSYLRDTCSEIHCRSSNNKQCRRWINEIFPDLKSLKKETLESHTLSHLLSYSDDFIMKFANEVLKNFLKTLNPPSETTPLSSPSFSYGVNLATATSMVGGLLHGQMAYPSFPVVNKLLRLKYTANDRQMFADVFIFDKCRYVYDQLTTVDFVEHFLHDRIDGMVIRIVVDGLRKHLQRICYLDVFQHCCVAPIDAAVDGGVNTALPSIPKRHEVKDLMKDKANEEG